MRHKDFSWSPMRHKLILLFVLLFGVAQAQDSLAIYHKDKVKPLVTFKEKSKAIKKLDSLENIYSPQKLRMYWWDKDYNLRKCTRKINYQSI